MTVGEFKELIKNINENLELYVFDFDGCNFGSVDDYCLNHNRQRFWVQV